MPTTDGLTLLIDDVRYFRDGRPCLVARSSADGVRLLETHSCAQIDNLWLDHDLVGHDDIWPVMRLLEDAALRGAPLNIGMVHVHASRSLARHQMMITLRRSGYTATRSTDLGMWTW